MFSLRDARRVAPPQRLSSSRRIHMLGLYSGMHPLTYRALVGIQFRYNHDGCIPHTPRPSQPRAPHYPLQAVIIIVTSGAKFGPVGPQTFTARTSPGRTWPQTVVFIVMRSCTANCDICPCIISTPRDRFSPLACACATTDSRVRLKQAGSRTAEVLTAHFSMSLLGGSKKLSAKPTE